MKASPILHQHDGVGTWYVSLIIRAEIWPFVHGTSEIILFSLGLLLLKDNKVTLCYGCVKNTRDLCI
jgi:hypothetical protein